MYIYIKYIYFFYLQVALYSRQELNIRSASNYLVAFAATHEKCRRFVKKYFKAIVVLPSDWIEIAEFCVVSISFFLNCCFFYAFIIKLTQFS